MIDTCVCAGHDEAVHERRLERQGPRDADAALQQVNTDNVTVLVCAAVFQLG
jgi:hypothetical protein